MLSINESTEWETFRNIYKYSVIIYAACLVINYSILEKNVTTQSIVRKYCMDKKIIIVSFSLANIGINLNIVF
jgi:hypothetical protein